MLKVQPPFRYVGKPVTRVDGVAKVTGKLKFMSDLSFPHMLWGAVLRSRYPHALIRSIDTSKAAQLPGVAAVLTHRDVPGVNRCGAVLQDQPVLCDTKVAHLGDAVALVAAETRELARRACDLIEVEYEPLPVVDTIEKALDPSMPHVHEGGNVFCRRVISQGDVEAAFREAEVIIENTYETGRQLHGYLETESGVAYLDDDDTLVVCCGSQAGYRDALQIARVLGIPMEKVQVISSPLGGGFGGKDDVTIEIYLALLAWKTRRPVKIVLDRSESIVASFKRHPMRIKMKTAAAREGRLLANEVEIYADTGAYLSLGRSILYLAMEHCCSCYVIPHVKITGVLLFTNNGVSGACRGFGVNQAIFAMESQMDILARTLDKDPLELRMLNAVKEGDKLAPGQTLKYSVGAWETMEACYRSTLWRQREELKAQASAPWKRRGIGVASALKCVGFGKGLPEQGRARIKVGPSGDLQVAVNFEDMGQGSATAFQVIAAEALGCPLEKVRVIVGDTRETLDSGATSASRATYLGGQAILAAAAKLKELLLDLPGMRKKAAQYRKLSCWELLTIANIPPSGLVAEGTFDPPQADVEWPEIVGIPHYLFSYQTQIALVEVDTLTGQVEVLETFAATEAGRVIEPQGFKGQILGGTAMGMGYTLWEDLPMVEGRYISTSLSDYLMPLAVDVPVTQVQAIEKPAPVGPFGAKGVGELACIPITPAITNAIYDAVGVRITKLPATPEKVWAGILQRRQGGF